MTKKCLILANGRAPSLSAVKYLASKGFTTLICADGGANSALKLKLMPHIIIGDLDSIRKEVYSFYDGKCGIIRVSRQNDTDVEKCLKYAIRHKFSEAVLLGATGDRLDHSFCNMGITLKYYDKIRCSILHQKSFLQVFTGNVRMKTTAGETISIYGIENKTKITSAGLQYKLNNAPLPFGVRESTSNVALNGSISLKIVNGKVFVIRNFDVMRKYDLF